MLPNTWRSRYVRCMGRAHSLSRPNFQTQRHELRDGDPDRVLATLSELAAQFPAQAEIINDTLGYFTKRRDQINYPAFKAAAWPIGSGAGEAAHKVVVEARLKQAGMRWATDNVNPMVALRNLHLQ